MGAGEENRGRVAAREVEKVQVKRYIPISNRV